MGKSFGVRSKKTTNKVHNSDGVCLTSKIDIRNRVMSIVSPAHVFDAYCGPVGEMWRAIWSRADSYVGCDVVFDLADKRKRLVGDTLRIMRTIELGGFNVFDIDAFGSPWEAMSVLLERRRWLDGEIGAVILTDGTGMNTRWGAVPDAMAKLVGIGGGRLAPTGTSADVPQSMALQSWCKLANVTPKHIWQSKGTSSGRGTLTMVYTAAVFEGGRCVS